MFESLAWIFHSANAAINMQHALTITKKTFHPQDEMVKAVQKNTEPPQAAAVADDDDDEPAGEGGEEEPQTDDGLDVEWPKFVYPKRIEPCRPDWNVAPKKLVPKKPLAGRAASKPLKSRWCVVWSFEWFTNS